MKTRIDAEAARSSSSGRGAVAGSVSRGQGSGTPRAGKRRRAFGFSTLELLILVVVVATIAAVGIPNLLASIQRYRARSATDEVAGNLRQVQSHAMTSGTRHRLALRDCPSGPAPCKQYRLEREGAGSVWPGAAATTATNANVLTDWRDLQSVYTGVRITSLKDNGGTERTSITFDSLGASVNPGASYPLVVTVTSISGAQRTIQVRSAGSMRMQ